MQLFKRAFSALAGPKLKDPTLFRQQCFLNGQWSDAGSKAVYQVFNPATGELMGTVPLMGAAETTSAIEAAKQAFPNWKNTNVQERSAVLMRMRNLMMDNADDLATLMTMEQGKPLAEARGEVVYAAQFLELYAEEAKRMYGDVLGQGNTRILTVREPVGVVGLITPWNFPSAMVTRKLGPALAAGCPVVIKPSELTPYSALALCELAVRAGAPPGVVNCLTGDAVEIGNTLCASFAVRKISFTGSTRVGKLLMQQCGPSLKRLSLELGGNAPFIIFDDCNLDAAVQGVVASKFRNCGQTCVSANRILVQAGVYDAFVAALTVAVAALRLGNGLLQGVTTGPLINAAAVKKVTELRDDAVALGAHLTVGGLPPALADGAVPALFVSPTVIADATSAMRVFREEAFGPICPVFKFGSEEEAVRMANDTTAGLAAYVYTQNGSRQWRVAEALEYGMVGVNQPMVSAAAAPFGGVKESGFGREGSYLGLDEYLSVKAVHMNLK